MTSCADGAGPHLVGEGAHDVERDVGLDQGAAHLAHRLVDVGLGQRAAPGQPVEDAGRGVRKGSQTCWPSLHPVPLMGDGAAPAVATHRQPSKRRSRPRAQRAGGR